MTFLIKITAAIMFVSGVNCATGVAPEGLYQEQPKMSRKDRVQTTGPMALALWEEPKIEKAIVLTFDYGAAGYIILRSLPHLDPLSFFSGTAVAFLLADGASGLFHGLGDELTENEDAKNGGDRSQIAKIFSFAKRNAFRGSHMHHEHPWLLKEMPYYEKVRGYHFLWAPFLLGTLTCFDGGVVSYTLTVFGMAAANCEVFHSIAHGLWDDNAVIETAKEKGIILSKKHHNVHHHGDKKRGLEKFKYNFCLIQGTLMDRVINPLFDIVRKWCGPRANQVCDE